MGWGSCRGGRRRAARSRIDDSTRRRGGGPRRRGWSERGGATDRRSAAEVEGQAWRRGQGRAIGPGAEGRASRRPTAARGGLPSSHRGRRTRCDLRDRCRIGFRRGEGIQASPALGPGVGEGVAFIPAEGARPDDRSGGHQGPRHEDAQAEQGQGARHVPSSGRRGGADLPQHRECRIQGQLSMGANGQATRGPHPGRGLSGPACRRIISATILGPRRSSGRRPVGTLCFRPPESSPWPCGPGER